MTQTKQNKEKVADYLHEVDKPLARYRDDKDLEMMLKEKDRDDDPMLAYMKQKKKKQDIKVGKKGEIGAKLKGHYFLVLFFNPINLNILLTVPHAFLLWYCWREFVLTSQHFIFGDHFIHSHDLYIWSGSVIVGRNWMLVTTGTQRGCDTAVQFILFVIQIVRSLLHSCSF